MTKPFAEVAYNEAEHSWQLTAGGVVVDEDGPTSNGWDEQNGELPRARDCAARINAAVEKREAALRGPLADLLQASRDFDGIAFSGPGLGSEERAAWRIDMDKAAAALGPNPPAYVPAAKLAESEAKVKQLQAVVDAIETSDGDHFATDAEKSRVVSEALRYLEANGLVKPDPSRWSDEELLQRQMEADRERARRRNLATPPGQVHEFQLASSLDTSPICAVCRRQRRHPLHGPDPGAKCALQSCASPALTPFGLFCEAHQRAADRDRR